MDTFQQVAVIPRDKQGPVSPVRQRRSIAEKRRIVEETLAPGASVAQLWPATCQSRPGAAPNRVRYASMAEGGYG